MFNALMKVQWKWTRLAVLIATLAGFAIPLGSTRGLFTAGSYLQITAADVVRWMESAAPVYAFLAGFTGLAVAFLAWNADQKGRHIYALSLPVSRARYAAMRFGAGALFLLLPAAGVLFGSLVALATVQLPPGMHGYPLALTLRFLIATFVAFSLFFAAAAASQRAAATVLGGIIGFIIVAVLVQAMGVRADILGNTISFLFVEPGLLSIFTGRWMLIDV
jgi:hypothetical protein